jgi:peroxiredoxin
MSAIEIGQQPPSFRLPAGQGGEIGTEDYRGRSHLVVWFTKGMGCPFCRTQMSQLARGYPKLKAAGIEVLQVTPTKPDRARFYAQHFPIPFPYLCDPDYRAHRAWGVDVRSHSLAWYARMFHAASKMPTPTAEIGNPKTTLAEMPSMLHDSDMGFFVLDRDGVLRYKRTSPYMSAHGLGDIPTVDEILPMVGASASPGAMPRRSA